MASLRMSSSSVQTCRADGQHVMTPNFSSYIGPALTAHSEEAPDPNSHSEEQETASFWSAMESSVRDGGMAEMQPYWLRELSFRYR